MKSFLNKKQYDKIINELGSKYWLKNKDRRWAYIEASLEEVYKLNPLSVIELGTNSITLSNFSDTINIKPTDHFYRETKCVDYVFDARKTPWDIEDKKYDLFVAMQVFEHLSPAQPKVFNEIKRISKNCILTFPYLWNCPTNLMHHHIDDYLIANWTNMTAPYKKILVKDKRMLDTLILIYKF